MKILLFLGSRIPGNCSGTNVVTGESHQKGMKNSQKANSFSPGNRTGEKEGTEFTEKSKSQENRNRRGIESDGKSMDLSVVYV